MQLKTLLLASGLLAFALGDSCPFGHDSVGQGIPPQDRAMLLEALKQNPAAAVELLAAYRERAAVFPQNKPSQHMMESREQVSPWPAFSSRIRHRLKVK